MLNDRNQFPDKGSRIRHRVACHGAPPLLNTNRKTLILNCLSDGDITTLFASDIRPVLCRILEEEHNRNRNRDCNRKQDQYNLEPARETVGTLLCLFED